MQFLQLELDAAREMIGALAIIGLLAVAYGTVLRRIAARGSALVLLGSMFGVMAMLEMLDPVELMPGVIADVRSLPLALAGAFLGWRGLLPAVAIAMVTRAGIGGTGAEAGLFGMVLISVGALGWHHLYGRAPQRHVGHLLALAVLVNAALVSVFIMPYGIAISFLTYMGPVIVVLNTAGILLAGSLMEREHRLALEAEHLKQSAVIDPATGFLNRFGFRRALSRSCARDDEGRGWAGMLIDIEHKSWLMCTLGQGALNSVIEGLPARLEPHLRRGDICAHLGGGKMAVLLPDISETEAQETANLILREIAQRPFAFDASAGPDPENRIRVKGHMGLTWSRSAPVPQQALSAMQDALAMARPAGAPRLATLKIAGEWSSIADEFRKTASLRHLVAAE